MNQGQLTYQLGTTLVTMAAGVTATQVQAGKGVNGWWIKKISGGTLAIVNSYGQTSVNGYIMGDTEVFKIEGAARFFLAAGGVTTVAGLVASYSSGYSLFPS